MEQTFTFIKPDGFENNNHANIVEMINQFVKKYDFKIVHEHEGVLKEDFLIFHYAVHLDKPFYEELIEELKDHPFHAFIIEGEGAIDLVRNELQPEVRAKYQKNKIENTMHASDAPRTAKYEIKNYLNYYE